MWNILNKMKKWKKEEWITYRQVSGFVTHRYRIASHPWSSLLILLSSFWQVSAVIFLFYVRSVWLCACVLCAVFNLCILIDLIITEFCFYHNVSFFTRVSFYTSISARYIRLPFLSINKFSSAAMLLSCTRWTRLMFSLLFCKWKWLSSLELLSGHFQ